MKQSALRVVVSGAVQWGSVRGALVAQEHRTLYAGIRFGVQVALHALL